MTPTDFENLSGLIFVFCNAIMSFWTVEDACPYKENGNILMRSSLSNALFYSWFSPNKISTSFCIPVGMGAVKRICSLVRG